MNIAKSYFYYESVKDNSEAEAAIREKAELGGDGGGYKKITVWDLSKYNGGS